jgi:glycerol-3-phosphate dehydrogenase
MAVTVEDVLARRHRWLFRDAEAAARLAPAVASVLKEETGIDPELPSFLRLCARYRELPSDNSEKTAECG